MGEEACSNLSGHAKPITSCNRTHFTQKTNLKMGYVKVAFSNIQRVISEPFTPLVTIPILPRKILKNGL